MHSIKKNKLQLNRETLMPLDASQLEDVNGGTSGLVRLSIRTCVAASKAASKATVQATGWLTRNVCPSAAIEATIRLTGGGNKE